MDTKTARKACDLCYNKRIKCDGNKPRCSHCVTYNAECSHIAASRKAISRRQDKSLQARIERVESNLKLVTERVTQLESDASREPQPFPSYIPGFTIPERELSVPAADLPALPKVVPIIAHYLYTYNSVLPLFHAETLLSSVEGWYRSPPQRDTVTWATINVVLALAHRNSVPASSRSSANYLSNAQSALTKVITGDVKLNNVRVLVGLVMLFQGQQDLSAATMLIAVALRLAHRLGLHTREAYEHLDPSEASQRQRVFWIAYLLDRDLSMRTRQPPIQHDADIDLDLPSEEPDEAQTGFVFTADNVSSVNFFRARVLLARIQGKVYERLFSVQGRGWDPAKRTQNLRDIREMLYNWDLQMPSDFSPYALSQGNSPTSVRFFCVLYSARLLCLGWLGQANVMDSPWVSSLREYSRKPAVGTAAPPAPLPSGWQVLVNESRDFMRLYTSIAYKDPAFIWMTTCAYVSAMICLTANRIYFPHFRAVDPDMNMIESALLFVTGVIQQSDHEPLRRLLDACTDLVSYARSIGQQSIQGINTVSL